MEISSLLYQDGSDEVRQDVYHSGPVIITLFTHIKQLLWVDT